MEGWILKEESGNWWKIKLEKTYDLVITGFNISTEGRHRKKLKSLKCSEANLIAAQGRLRHPRFIRWRDDKSAKNCIFEAA